MLDAEGKRVASGTGFKVKNYLITNNHVFQPQSAAAVRVRFVQDDCVAVRAEKVFSASMFSALLVDGSPEANWDFAILNLASCQEFASVPSLELSEVPPPVGSPVALLGFQFEHENLSMHSGILSSRFTRVNVKYLQLDASVNSGNSGGPLIDPATNSVIGIVTRKGTGLTEAFAGLSATYDANIAAFASFKGMIGFGEVDAGDIFALGQRQLQLLSKEIQRSANVGIGFAYELAEIKRSSAWF